MTPIQQSYINGIDFAIGEINKTLDNILIDPNTSVHPKFSFLEPIKELVIYKNTPNIVEIPNKEMEEENIKLKKQLAKHKEIFIEIMQTSKAKKISRLLISEMAKL